jgi:hypothetical protein
LPGSEGLQFEWDRPKASANYRRHGLEFAEAVTAFADPLSLVIPDPDHSAVEERFVLMGHVVDGRLVVVAFTERGQRLRVISARLASRRERRAYEESN